MKNCVYLIGFLVILASISVSNGCIPQDRPLDVFEADTSRTTAGSTEIIPLKAHTPTDSSASTPIDLNQQSVEEIMRGMTLREKIGQLFFIRARGYFQNEDSEEYRELLTKIKDYKAGGIVFFKGNVYGQTVLTNKLQAASRIPLWITQDMEFGAAMRVEGTTRITPAMGIAATGNANNAYRAGQITGGEAKALGVNQIFAPVLDVNNNPENPVINVRSFSGDPAVVADFGNRFIAGVSSQGVISTAKHFPGHGDTDTDSHYSLPIIKSDYARLDSVELVPFRAAIRAKVPSIMSAHINFPGISLNRNLPSTLDKSILNRILTDSLGFQGLVVTDALEMAGIASNYSPGQASRLALQAGADILLLSPDELTAINELEQAVRDSSISEERIDKSVRKLLHWKKGAGLFENASVDLENLSSVISSTENRLLADEISRQSLTLLKNERSIIPIKKKRFRRLLFISVANDYTGQTGQFFAQQMRRYHPAVRFEVFDERTGSEEERNILRDAAWADLIVIGSYIRVGRNDENQLSDRQRKFLNKLPKNKPKALLALENPYVVSDMPNAEVHLLAWDDSDEQIRNLVPALFGKSAIGGKLPINIPGMYKLGHQVRQPRAESCYDAPRSAGFDTEKLQKVEHIITNAIADSTFPGGVVAVVKNDMLAYCNAFGYQTYEKEIEVAPNDVYDLASLTKIVATTASVMKLVDEGKISPDERILNFFPEFKKGLKRNITVRHLLLHTSGLPAFRVYVDSLKTREKILEAVKNEPLINEPNTKYVYSDLGFILLGEIVQQLTGLPLDEYVRKTFYEPLGMESTRFNPKEVGEWLSSRIPPTEIDNLYRNETIQGEAHDERAWFMDGVAGHAGLFSNVQDLAIFAQMLLRKGSYAGKQYIKPETLRAFTGKQSNLHNRGLGFDRKSPTGFTTAGSLTGNRTYGHLGFTGTSLWVDPDHDTAIILLTNRTYPKRSYGKNISKIRAAVADAVVSSIKKNE